ncbi:FRIGIDA-like protein 1 [Humulus lupulus]|uniref:FRIGIDA-like protein 1 n=1 Tax=Humulus lupulus TaxID=3486 RepID=UPI002B41055F|nr:FRIGIDA-like protein 1 [Humulus lupulus]
MTTTLETISEALHQIDTKKENLKKAFDELQPHSSLIPSFSLTWSDLDSHFSSIQNSLNQKFQTLKTLDFPSNHLSSSPNSTTHPSADPSSSPLSVKEKRADSVSNGVPDFVPPRPELIAFCKKMDGLGLRKYVSETTKDRNEIRVELPGAIRLAPDPAAMILDAMEGFFRPNEKNKGDKDLELSSVRRSCVLLLEKLSVVSPNVGIETKDKAKTLALEWKGKMNTGDDENPLESLGFLHFVSVYGLVSEFNMDELVDNFVIIARYRQAVDLCRKIGLTDKVDDLIHKLVKKGKQLLAIKFIFEYELTDKFPPVPLLKDYVKESKKIAKKVCKEGKNSLKSLNEAATKEISALKSVIKVIEERKLESEYPQEFHEKRIEQLEKQKASRTRPPAAPAANPTLPQHQLAREKQKQQSGNKRPRPDGSLGSTAAPVTFRAANSTISSYQQSHLQPTHLSPDGSTSYASSSAALYGMPGLVPPPAAFAGSSAGTLGLAGALMGFTGSPTGTSSHYAAEPYVPSGYYDRPTSHVGHDLPPQYHPSYYPQ